jgi:hypothetical protein
MRPKKGERYTGQDSVRKGGHACKVFSYAAPLSSPTSHCMKIGQSRWLRVPTLSVESTHR